ncbi:MAG: NUDIX hydrolase [Acidimicrobiales bacterium]
MARRPEGGPAPRPEVCVGGVALSDDRLLLIRRGRGPAQGEWSIPGGRVEWGETLAEAVVREVAEETGLTSACAEMIGWVERIDDDSHQLIIDYWVVPLDDEEPVAGDDAAEVAWVPLGEISELRLVDGLAEFLADHGIIDLVT